jgi:hypothetical protein
MQLVIESFEKRKFYIPGNVKGIELTTSGNSVFYK